MGFVSTQILCGIIYVISGCMDSHNVTVDFNHFERRRDKKLDRKSFLNISGVNLAYFSNSVTCNTKNS